MKNTRISLRTRLLSLLGALTFATGCASVGEGEVESRELALTGADAFGFENLALWTVSQGTKQSLTGGTQGSSALGVSNSYYSEITSAVIDAVGVVSGTLALDVKLPASATWGSLRLVLEMPSKGIWYGNLGEIQLATLQPGAYRTVQFTVPSNVLSALQTNPSDLKVRIVYNGQIGATPVGFDNLRFVGAAAPNSVVEVRVNHADDVAYLQVNGLERRIGYWGDPNVGQWRDVTSWFVGGDNDVRLIANNYGGLGGVDVEFRVDGVVVDHVECDGTTCFAPEHHAFVKRDVELPSLVLPAGKQVQVTSVTPGKLYVDDQYTGRTTPTTLTLPSGTYRLGLGVSNDAPTNTTGSFYEESVVVGSGAVSVTLGDTPPLGPTNVSKIAILPVRRARVTSSNELAILSDAEVNKFASQLAATSEIYVKPFSYGLNTWEITVLPVEEELEVVSPDFAEFPDHACGDVVAQPKYAHLYDLYDTVVVHMSNKSSTTGLEIGRGDAGMSGRCGQVQEHWGRNISATTPIPVVVHEVLHSYETHHWEVEKQWNGVSGLHGAEVHGFQSTGTQGEIEWTEWYRHYMRGQAAEVTSMVPGVAGPRPTTADTYVGVFRSVRYGLWH